eukprot:TRINITY_DN3428_c0_g2_i17.p1 TRINITY_DN3428_c0_g2~~TRINITY_DN3428_c0_g2_i17.p1  ORF type:complete len:419 (-),score=90.55 TRINITY_DN3428_c0_g2_i17:158-1414(-)
MPKGSLLHSHAIGDPWFLLKEGSYDPECWINVGSKVGDILQYGFTFSSSAPYAPAGVVWKKVSDWRSEYADPDVFDTEVLYPVLQFYTPNLTVTQDDMWVYFDTVINRGASLSSKESIWRSWVLNALQTLVDDGIIHLEVRGFMNFITQPGTTVNAYNDTMMVYLWQDILKEFNSNVPPNQRISVRFINAVPRFLSQSQVWKAVKKTIEMQQNSDIGHYVVGFDIVDEEDRYNTIIYYLDVWLKTGELLASLGLPPMKYFFHAGETTWYKREKSNIFDAVLLNSTRIGHGFGLSKYPLLQQQVKAKGIAIEVAPISNQLLRLVNDVRDHPAREMLSDGLAVTLSSDDGVIYGYNGVSFDFWAAHHSWNLSLAGLKRLALNSLQYSALNDAEKLLKKLQFDDLWNTWLNDVSAKYLNKS